jgi:hypothetical protein
MANKINWDDILVEWSYRLPKGYPTMKDGKFTSKKELAILDEILAENGISNEPTTETNTTFNESKTIEDINKLVAAMSLRTDQINKLYDVIKTFSLYEPIKNTLLKKTQGYEDLSKEGKATKQAIYKEFTNKLKNILEKLSGSALVKFQGYLQKRLNGQEPPVNFPENTGKGYFKFPTEIETELGNALAKHTGQDEQKKGVGQGELMMTLVYDNVSQPAGKGDVYLNGVGELEVKGYSAIMGKGRPEEFAFDTAWLEKFGLEGGVWPSGKKHFAPYLVDLYNKQDAQGKAEFLAGFQEALKTNKLYSGIASRVDEFISAESFKDAQTLSNHVGVLNFFIYHAEEEFACFIAHDYGSGKAGNTGLYVFAKGGVDEMARTLYTTPEAKFQLIGVKNIKPRIIVGAGPGIEESLEEDSENRL